MIPFAGPAVALVSAAVLGSADFVGGELSKRLRALQVVAWSHFIVFVLLTGVVVVGGFPATWGWLPWALLAGACSGLGLLCFYEALATGTMGVVAPLASIGVVIPVAWAILTGEQPGIWHGLGILLAIAGSVLSSGPEFRSDERHRARAVVLALVSAVLFGVMTIGIVEGSSSSTMMTMWGMRGTSGLGLMLVAVATRQAGGVDRRRLLQLAGLGILDVCGNVLLATSTKLGMVSIGVVLSSLYPVFTIALAAWLLKERLKGVQVWGMVLALLGIVLVNVPA